MFRQLEQAEAEQVTAWRPPALPGKRGTDPAINAALARLGIASDAVRGKASSEDADGVATASSPVTVQSEQDIAAQRASAAQAASDDEVRSDGEMVADSASTPFDDGFEAGARGARESLGADMQTLIAAFVAERERWRAERESEVMMMAQALAEAILRRELIDDPEQLARLVAQALKQFDVGESRVVVQLHPLDLAALDALNRLDVDADLVADETLQRGDCRLRCGDGLIQAGVTDRLAALLSEAST